MINNFISVKSIMAKLYRDLDVNKEINESSVIEWVNEVLLKVGAYSQFTEVSACLDLNEGKACLPSGLYRLVNIAYDGRPLAWASNTMAHNYQCEGCKIPTCCEEHTFYINNNYIITSVTDHDISQKLCVVYLGIPIDDEGYPMIPDDVYYGEACASYVTYMLDKQEWRKGLLPDKVFQKSEQDYLFYINSARGAANMPNLAQLENLKNVLVRLIPNQNAYNNFFTKNASQERRRLF